MASFTNLVTPAQSALNNKKDYNPLSYLSRAYNPMAAFPTKPLNIPRASPVSLNLSPRVNAPISPSPIKPAPAGTSVGIPSRVQPTQTPVNNPAPVDNSALKSALQAHLSTLQSQLKDQQARESLAADQAKADAKTAEEKAATPTPPTPFGGLIGQAAGKYGEAAALGTELAGRTQAMQQKTYDVKHNPYYSGDVRTGAGAQIAQTEGVQLSGLAAQQAALTGQATGLASLAGAVKPSPATYGQTVFNPMTGQYEDSSGGGNLDPNSLAASLAPLVASGQMDINTAASQMTGGVAGSAALRNAILKINPTFNFNLSSSSAGTQATGQQMKTSALSANQALDTLQEKYNGLGQFTGGSNIPLLNEFGQNIAMATGVGRDAVSAYQGALKEARAQVNTVLAPLVGVESANATSNSLLPDNMKPSEVPQKIAAAKEYLKQRVSAFIASGNQQTNVSTASGGLFDW